MDDAERQRAIELITEQEALLIAVALGHRDPDEAEGEYKRRHNELRVLLAKDTLPCLCPWGSVKPWAYGVAADWRARLDRMRAPLLPLLEPRDRTRWRLVLYRRGGDPDDLPFVTEFEDLISDEEWTVLDSSLLRELAVLGTALLRDQRKAHPFGCGGGRHPQPTVLMYKIEEAAPSGRVVLRVFFETAADHTIVLLHGYDKGGDPSDLRERAEAREACLRRRDLLTQLAKTGSAPAALATPRDP